MKSINILLAATSLACMVGFTNAEDMPGQVSDLNVNRMEGSGSEETGSAINRDIVLPAALFRAEKNSKALSAQNISPVKALEKAFHKGRTPTKADLLDYSIGWYIPTDSNRSDLSILMFGFKATPNDVPGDLFHKEAFVRILTFKDRDFLRNATAKDLIQFDDDFVKSPCYGPVKFSEDSAIAKNNDPMAYHPTWTFRVYEKYLLVEVRQGITLGYGYFYRKLKEPIQPK